ncbi:uncharacterized protein LOC118685339 [Molothrus ater]|uniref:uncharacterized protein LOC118685339 n=1 Tax=Molothrus ater TaxID=84834 RepID=UPI0017497CF6|nr:uncharacterized protein LOC118685339 [Molothrus ater]
MGWGADLGRGDAKSFSCPLPSRGAGYLAPSLLSLPSSALGLAGVAPHSLLPPCVRVCERLPLLLPAAAAAAAAAASSPTFSPPRSVSGEAAPFLPVPSCSSPCPALPGHPTPHTRPHLASPLPSLIGWDGSALEGHVPFSRSVHP